MTQKESIYSINTKNIKKVENTSNIDFKSCLKLMNMLSFIVINNINYINEDKSRRLIYA